jgi:hypothetical protein
MKKQNFNIAKTTVVTIVILTVLLIGFSCSKKDLAELTTIGFSYSYDIDVPATDITDSLRTSAQYVSPLIDTQSAEKIKGAKTSADFVSKIKITKFKVTCIGGTSNLDYVKSIQVFIKTDTTKAVFLMEKINIPAGAKSVDMDLMDVDIKEYVFKDQIQFLSFLTFKPTSSIDKQKLRMDATVLGRAKLP